MRRRISLILIGWLFLAACNAPPPTPTLAPAPDISPTLPALTPTANAIPTTAVTSAPPRSEAIFDFNREPVIKHGTEKELAGPFINPGAMVYHDEQFHMFRNTFTNWPGQVNIMYMTSPDGRNWSLEQNEPVFSSGDVPFANPGTAVSSVTIAPDGTWALYFHTVNQGNAPSLIGRAIAESPLGPWKVDSEPILRVGKAGEWDDSHLTWPNVVSTDSGYAMIYTGENNSGTRMIGRATSPDGVAWTKHNNESTRQAPFAESDPILTASADWEQNSIERPEVQLTSEGWVMVYAGKGLNQRGLAFSPDGIVWTPYAANPIISTRTLPTRGTTWDNALLYHEGVYYYFMEVGSLLSTDIYLGTHEGFFNEP